MEMNLTKCVKLSRTKFNFYLSVLAYPLILSFLQEWNKFLFVIYI